MAIQTRQQLADYCLRRLGAPVIKIDMSDEQLEDRIDDALQKFSEFHYDGTHRAYYKHIITTDDKTNGYIVLPDNIIGAVDIFPLQGFAISGHDMFDVRYQIALNDLYTLAGTNLVPYVMTMTHLNVMNELLIGRIPIRYSRRNGNKLYLDTDFKNIDVGQYIVVEAFQVVDPEEFAGVYDEIWLKDYLTALLRIQWGENLSKFTGQPLPGGMVLNGQEILARGDRDKAACLEELDNRYVLPPLMRMA